MNHNNIYFIQVQKATGMRQCFVVSAPTEKEAQLATAPYVDLKKDMIISSEWVTDMIDTFEYMDGKAYVKMHN